MFFSLPTGVDGAEMMKVLDVPEEMASSLSSSLVSSICKSTSFISLKCALSLLWGMSITEQFIGTGEDKGKGSTSACPVLGPSATVILSSSLPVEKKIKLQGEDRDDRGLKAAKGDDAEVPEYLWDEQILDKLDETT